MRRIFVGFDCNNGCVFCAQADERRRPASTANKRASVVEAVAAALSTIVQNDTVAFVGGEPTAHAELPGWMGEAARRGAARIVIQTNGRRLAYADYARDLAAAAGSALLSFDVSLHGSTREMHDHLTRVPGSFGQTLLGLRHARAAGIPCVVTTVVTRANYRHLTEIVRLLRAVDVRTLRFVSVDPRGDGRGAIVPHAPPASMLAPRVAVAREMARRLGVELLVDDPSAADERFGGASVVTESP